MTDSGEGKSRVLTIVLVVLLFMVAVSVAVFTGWHQFLSARADDSAALSRLAERYWEVEGLEIRATEQRGDYLAALLVDPKNRWYLCEYERDWVWRNRWCAGGGKAKLSPGVLNSWNYGSPRGEAILIVCGFILDDRVYWYSFRNDGVTYICPVRDEPVLDIFVIPDSWDISAVPRPLGKDYTQLD